MLIQWTNHPWNYLILVHTVFHLPTAEGVRKEGTGRDETLGMGLLTSLIWSPWEKHYRLSFPVSAEVVLLVSWFKKYYSHISCAFNLCSVVGSFYTDQDIAIISNGLSVPATSCQREVLSRECLYLQGQLCLSLLSVNGCFYTNQEIAIFPMGYLFPSYLLSKWSIALLVC